MKKLSVLLFVFFAAQNFASASVPSCLQDNGVDQNQNRLIDGGYILSIDSHQYSKAGLLQLLESLEPNQDIFPLNFPFILSNMISIDLVPNRIGSDESFLAIQTRVEAAMAKLQAKPGVTVRCNYKPVPHPGVTGSN